MNVLQHSNMATKIHGRDPLMMLDKKMNTELRLIHPLIGSNKHGKSANDNRFQTW